MKTSAKTKALAGLLLVAAALMTLWWMPPGQEVVQHTDVARQPEAPVPSEPQAQKPSEDRLAVAVPPPVDLDGVDRDRDLHGIVVNERAAPVPGAHLMAVSYPWRRTNLATTDAVDKRQDGPEAVSAIDGTFALQLRRGALVHLRVEARGYAPLELTMLQSGECVRVVMKPAVSLEVTLCDVAGRPVEGVHVRLRRSWRWGDLQLHRSGRTGPDGRFRFDDLPGGVAVRLDASHALQGRPRRKRITLPDEGTAQVELRMTKGRIYTGRVTDAETGMPIANARVGMGWTLDPETKTDTDGRYAFNGWLGPNTYHSINVAAEGYARAARQVGAAGRHDFELRKGDSVTGRLVGPDRRPVAGAHVSAAGLLREGIHSVSSTRHGVSDGSGVFVLDGLSRAMPHTLIVLAPGCGRTLLDFDPHPGGPGTVDLGEIALPPGRAIEGKVVEASGEPVPRVPVDLRGANADRGRMRKGRRRLFGSYGSWERRFTDDLGRFRFPDLAPGRYEVMVERLASTTARTSVELTESSDVRHLTVRFPEGRPFNVIVEDEEGRPVAGAIILVHHGAGRPQNTTGPDGRAAFTVSGAIRRVTLIRPDRADEASQLYRPVNPIEHLPEGVSEARFVLEIGEAIRGTVLDAEDQPVPGALIEVRQQGRKVTSTSSGFEGRFQVTVAPGGSFDLVVTGKHVPFRGGGGGYIRDSGVEGELLGVAAGSRDVVLRAHRVQTTRTLLVHVLAPDGSPQQGARVPYPSEPGQARRQPALTDADGVAILTNLPAREITVSAHGGNRRHVPPKVLTVVPNGQEVVLRFRMGIALPGLVVDTGGRPVSGVTILARGGGQLLCQTFSDARGRFELLVPSDEHIDIDAWHRVENGKNLVARRRGLRAGDVDELRLELNPRK